MKSSFELFFRHWREQIQVDLPRNVVKPICMMVAGLVVWSVGAVVVVVIKSNNTALASLEFCFAVVGLVGLLAAVIGFGQLFFRCMPRMPY